MGNSINERLSSIEGESAEITIPLREVLEGVENGEQVRMAAFLFRNMSGLLPGSLEMTENQTLIRCD